MPDAIAQSAALAKYPNVSVKLSSVPLISTEPYPFRDVIPHIHRLFDAYGPECCYWGTDVTNSFARATYRQRVTQFTEELPFLTESDKDWIMGRAILARLKSTCAPLSRPSPRRSVSRGGSFYEVPCAVRTLRRC